MRIKVTTSPTLPTLKAWFLVPTSSHSIPGEFTVVTLKSHLCNALPPLRQISPSSLSLSVDGFELLDECEIGVVRDGDLVCIAQKPPSAHGHEHRSGNQKHSSPEIPSSRASATSKKRKRRDTTPTPETENSSSPASTSTSSPSASDSDSESESSGLTSGYSEESDSDLNSATSSSASLERTGTSAPSPGLGPQGKIQPSDQSQKPACQVPPGFGKPQTHSRNRRRRIKRLHERGAAVNTIVTTNTEHNTQSTAASCAGVSPLPWAGNLGGDSNPLLSLPSLSLRNKNKAKNFRSFMKKPLPPRILFDEVDGHATQTCTSKPPQTGRDEVGDALRCERTPQSTTPLVPPSCRASLPPNLFVTSVDVEESLHRHKKRRRLHGAVEYGAELGSHGRHESVLERVAPEEEVAIDYGDGDDALGQRELTPSFKGSAPLANFDIEAMERVAKENWTTLPKVSQAKELNFGDVVGYKALSINPATFTPELLLTLVQVVFVTHDTEDACLKVAVRPLRQHVEVSFGGCLGENGLNGEERADEVFEWFDVVNGDWRVVRAASSSSVPRT